MVEARDAWWLLDRWRARRQFVWTAGSKSVSQISQFLCARAGLDYGAISASAALIAVKPAFTVHPCESGRTAVRRLLAMVRTRRSCRARAARCASRRAATASTTPSAATTRSSRGRDVDLGAGVNRARVFGDAVFDEAFDFAEIDSLGERIAQVLDLNLTTTAAAGDRAGFALREAAVRQRGDELLLAGINCGQELYDVVSVTDAQLGLVAAKRRFLGLTWRYATGRQACYDMTLLLGSP